MRNECRSMKGCWTCRVRKRKCDEEIPICSACKSLELECYGYGQQPAWMDRGSRQKAQATKIKQMVAEVRRKRRRGNVSSTDSHCRNSSHDFSLASVVTPTTPESSIWDNRSFSPFLSPGSPRLGNFDCTFPALDDLTFPDFPVTDIYLPEPQGTSRGIETSLSDNYTFEKESTSTHAIYFPSQSITKPRAIDIWGNTSRSKQSPKTTHPSASTKSVLAIDKVEDATFLAYYFEKVFNWQFPFCQLHTSAFDQGHIMWLVSKSQPLYHGTLALSSSHKYLQTNTDKRERKDLHLDEGSDGHTPQYDVAIKKFQIELQDPRSYEDVSLLACIVMFLHSARLYKSRSSDWRSHLDAGISIVNSWIDRLDQPFGSFGPCSYDEKDSEMDVVESAKVFLIGCIIRFDILSSLARNSVPALSERYQQLLQGSSYGIPLQGALQCRSWLFSILLDVYSLRSWKGKTQAEGLLSLRELMSRALPIKTTLERGIALNMEEINNFKKSPPNSSRATDTGLQSPDYGILVVTHIFACSISILLEVVLSGALPKLPEIQQGLSRALESYTYINNPELSSLLHWPLCVAASVAEPSQYDFFRSLLSSPNVAWIGTFRESLECLEEYWRRGADMKPTDAVIDAVRTRNFMAWDILIA
ncbi:hypothetical protein ACMFMG_009973 [Clarireedia jacksonii]